MEPKACGKYHHGDLRRALLEAAIAAIARDGPRRFSLRAVAHELHVSHAAAYRHFRNRDGLLRAVSIEGMQRLQRALLEAAQDSPSPTETVRRCAMAYVLFGLDNPGLYQVMFSEPTQRHDEARGAADAVLEMTAGIVEQAQCGGGVRPGDPFELARAAWAMLHGLVDLEQRRQLGDRSTEAVMEHAELLLETFFQGLFTH